MYYHRVQRERERETVNECQAHPEVHVSLSLYVGGVSHVHGRNFIAGLAGAIGADAVELGTVAGLRVAAGLFPIVVDECLLGLVAGDDPRPELSRAGG